MQILNQQILLLILMEIYILLILVYHKKKIIGILLSVLNYLIPLKKQYSKYLIKNKKLKLMVKFILLKMYLLKDYLHYIRYIYNKIQKGFNYKVENQILLHMMFGLFLYLLH